MCRVSWGFFLRSEIVIGLGMFAGRGRGFWFDFGYCFEIGLVRVDGFLVRLFFFRKFWVTKFIV